MMENKKPLVNTLVIFLSIILVGTIYILIKDSVSEKGTKLNTVKENTPQTVTQEAYEEIQTQYENSGTSDDKVPLPLEEDIISLFFHLVDDRRISEAVSMMSEKMAPNDSVKQAWGVQFNDIKSINVQNIEPAGEQDWTDNQHSYKVTLEAYVSSDAANAPIPYYGWVDNPNTRWVTLVKEDGMWKINELATGF